MLPIRKLFFIVVALNAFLLIFFLKGARDEYNDKRKPLPSIQIF